MFELQVLGGVSLRRQDKTPVAAVLAQPKRMALLTLLSASPVGAVVRRDTILGLLWAEMPDKSARSALNKAVYFLRQNLGDAAITTVGDGGVAANPDLIACDARSFDESIAADDLEGAVKLYSGPFLNGFFVDEAAEFEHWVTQERDRRARAFGRALESMAVAEEKDGHNDSAIDWWRRAVDHQKHDSRLVRSLMEALLRSGNPGGALEAAADHEQVLRRDLEVAPDAAIGELVARIRAFQTAPIVQERPTSARPSFTPRPSLATESTQATQPVPPVLHPTPSPLPRTVWLLGASAVAVAAFVAQCVITRDPTTAAPDTTVVAVMPFSTTAANRSIALDPAKRIYDAMKRWSGITPLDPDENGSKSGRHPPESLADAAQAARKLKAGRVLWGDVSTVGDTIRIHVRIADSYSATPIADRVVSLSSRLTGADSALRRANDELLLRDDSERSAVTEFGSHSLSAVQAYLAGRRAMDLWDLTAADGAFDKAVGFDSHFGRAYLWLGVSRDWRGVEAARYRLAAEQATLYSRDLTASEKAMSLAVLSESKGDLGESCQTWRKVISNDSLEVAGWYGTARCERVDSEVVRDPRSRSGWRFRSSVEHATQAYQRAFRLQPAILSSFSASSFAPLRRLFFADGRYYRTGYLSGSEPKRFLARVAIANDTLVLIPFPETQMPEERELSLFARAVARQRRIVKDVASSWVSAFPSQPDAWHALAIALAMMGDPSAPDTLEVAAKFAHRHDDRLQIALTSIWMNVTLGVTRGERDRVVRAKSLADSILARELPDSSNDPLQLSALAALVGKIDLSARFARSRRFAKSMVNQPPLFGIAMPFLVYAAFGGPPDSLASLESRLGAVIDQLEPGLKETQRYEWLARGATLCHPMCRLTTRDSLIGERDPLLQAQANLDGGKRDLVARWLTAVRAARRGLPPEIVSIDAILPEARLLVAMDDEHGAAEWLDPALRFASQIAPDALARPERTASLVQAIILRANIARSLGDNARASQLDELVTILWSGADSFAQRQFTARDSSAMGTRPGSAPRK